MTGDIPIRSLSRTARARRLSRVLHAGATNTPNDPPASEEIAPSGPPPAGSPAPDPAIFAQVLQTAEPAHRAGAGESAKSTYLKTEWSGRADRRMKPGSVTRTRI